MAKRYIQFVEENVIDNLDDVYNIIDLADKELSSNFDIKIDSKEIPITIFGVTFRTIVNLLKEKSISGYDKYKINLANRFEVGYDNTTNDEYEKNGGFIIYIKHLYQNFSTLREREYDDDTIALCVEWSATNITNDADAIKKISTTALTKLDTGYDIKLGTADCVIPIFVTIYDCLVAYLKIERASRKESEFEINFIGLFDIAAQESDDNDDIIRITPSIDLKLTIKSDGLGSAKYD